jgi:hypothetical protein
MATVEQVIEEAERCGFVATECVHEDSSGHLTFDYPRPLGNGISRRFWRVHINNNKTPRSVYIASPDDGNQRVSLKNAIDFMRTVVAINPKDEDGNLK